MATERVIYLTYAEAVVEHIELMRGLGEVRYGVFARALIEFNSELRKKLKKAGLLTRDPRAKERKKYGQKGARKRFQFSKR